MFADVFVQTSNHLSTWGIGDYAIAIVVFCAIVALVCVAVDFFEVKPPPWVVRIYGRTTCFHFLPREISEMSCWQTPNRLAMDLWDSLAARAA